MIMAAGNGARVPGEFNTGLALQRFAPNMASSCQHHVG